jgi:hypothetical protein
MIGHSSPTLEELPYIPIILNNRIISFPAGRRLVAAPGPTPRSPDYVHEEMVADLVFREFSRK